MKVSIVIPTLNRPADLKQTLTSILNQTCLPHEIIVVDQSDDGHTMDALGTVQTENFHRPVSIRYAFQNVKSSVKARNRGIEMAEGDLVSLVDDDVVLDPQYLEAVVRHFEANPDAGGVMGNMELPAGSHSQPKGWKWAARRILYRIFLLNFFNGRMTPSGFGYPIYDRRIDQPREVELFQAVVTYPKRILNHERFDEWFTGYSYREDAELSYRISRTARLLMVPDVRFFHKEAASNRLNAWNLKKMQIRNYHYVFRKHKYRGPLSYVIFGYSLAGIIAVDALECLLHPRKDKFAKLGAAASAIYALVSEVAGRKVTFPRVRSRRDPVPSQALP